MTEQEAFSIISEQVGVLDKARQQNDNPNNIESYLFNPLSVFIPVLNPCHYSISSNYTHPGYSFIYLFDENNEFIVEGKTRTSQGKGPFVCAMSPGIPPTKKSSRMESMTI